MPKKFVTALLSLFFAMLACSFTAEAVEKNKIPQDIKPYQDSLSAGDLLAKSHGDAGLSCQDCHDASSAYPEKGTFQDEFCLRCHDANEIEKKVVYTSKGAQVHPHDEHVGDIQCVDCHSMHSKSTLKCAECHVQPWMKTLPQRWEQPK
ncbi:cytochrome c3 family protein [Desulfopila aestuarii]|uniref:Cytochrome c3 n=1 Tax=Desulfopila aestuarii DSM 18488 TaxID=1121416 RepID=A0A1M7XYB2_9BACT|nr:cytochrome c3 family protein [Desulfopila aestuarii]SHO44020.1 Cytochrome c3 [Desulfopila aestuarii DSM 18488]